MPLVNRKTYAADGKTVIYTAMEISINQMTSEEYKQWLEANPEEEKKINLQQEELLKQGKKRFTYTNGILSAVE